MAPRDSEPVPHIRSAGRTRRDRSARELCTDPDMSGEPARDTNVYVIDLERHLHHARNWAGFFQPVRDSAPEVQAREEAQYMGTP
jgi:hypothetical protein